MSKSNKNMGANKITKTAITLRGEDLDMLLEAGSMLDANSEIVVALALSYKYNLSTSVDLYSKVGTKNFIGDTSLAKRQTFIKHTAEQKCAIDEIRLNKTDLMKKLGHRLKIDNVSLVQASLVKFHTDLKNGDIDWSSTPILNKFAEYRRNK